MSTDLSWRKTLHRSMLAVVLAAPLVAVGCAAPQEPQDDDAVATDDAFTRKPISVGEMLRVTAYKLNLRGSAGTSGAIIAVMNRNDMVTCATESGESGWVNVTTADGTTGWASLTYLDASRDDDGAIGDPAPPDSDTCSPDRADDVVNKFEKALHDTIAYAEGTRDNSKDGYNVLFSGIPVPACNRHPDRCIRFGRTCTTAAGRYQFLYTTWKSIVSVKGYATFEPENQERGATYLIGEVRKAKVPQDRALTAAEFSNAMTKLSYEWASLPPGQYGQPLKTMSQLRAVYCGLVSCGG